MFHKAKTMGLIGSKYYLVLTAKEATLLGKVYKQHLKPHPPIVAAGIFVAFLCGLEGDMNIAHRAGGHLEHILWDLKRAGELTEGQYDFLIEQKRQHDSASDAAYQSVLKRD